MSRRPELVWGLLAVATVLSWVMGGESASEPASVAILVVACIKVRLIGRHFMEIAGAHIALRLFLDAYLTVVGSTMIALYLAA